ncbi:MAG: hypothetical protein WC157_01315 [Candidatus Paceibacterota bacterium]
MELVNSIVDLPLSLEPITIIVLSFLVSLLIAFALYKFAAGQHVCCIAFYSIVAIIFIPAIIGAILGYFATILSTLALITAAVWTFYESKLQEGRIVRVVEANNDPLED